MSNKKGKKAKSETSLYSNTTKESKMHGLGLPALDELLFKIFGLWLPEEDPPYHAIKVTFLDQVLISAIIKPFGMKDDIVAFRERVIAKGSMLYDPSNYEKMCYFADTPLIDQDSICVKKRMQPMKARSCLYKKSWVNLPLLTMSIAAMRHAENAQHHRLLGNANWMKVTVVGAYNLLTPYNIDCYYTAATKIPICNESETEMTMFVEGTSVPRKFNSTSFFPRWETLRLQGEPFTKGDDKLQCDIADIYNPDNINLQYYLKEAPCNFNTIWGSFHRTLVLGSGEKALWNQLRQWRWPLEVHYYGDVVGGFSFMGFMDLFPLLYPGVRKLVLAVPLHWFNWQLMSEKCDCGVLLMPNDKLIGTPVYYKPKNERMTDSIPTTTTDEDQPYLQGTGGDDKTAFVLVEVQFGHSLIPETIPPYISRDELMQMLAEMEPQKGKRACRGRGQLNNNWLATVRAATSSLRRVPHHGLTDLCIFNRQLSESRTRVELVTSFCMDGAVYVNNNFVVPPFLEQKETYEELLLMAHVCMMKQTIETLVGKEDWQKIDPLLRAARHARQLNDIGHAMELYIQVAVQYPFDGDCWRELSTMLRDIDREWADVCLDKALSLNIRHPLTILAKGCMVFEECAVAAEAFFTSLLNMYPFWPTAYVVCSAFCTAIEHFRLADEMKLSLKMLREERLTQELPLPRAWERELGDFWEPTVLLPGMNSYYDAADLLLRIRAVRMAEVCLSIALSESGETAVYYHLVSICSRLKGDIPSALCLAQKGIQMFGQSTAFKCLEGEFYHEMGDTTSALVAFEKAKGGTHCYSTMLSLPCWDRAHVRLILVELLRRQPNAYGWMALANDWILRMQTEEDQGAGDTQKQNAPPAVTCAMACAVQALKLDRRAGRAWAMLAKLVKPQNRRLFCTNMAIECGYMNVEETDIREIRRNSQESLCHLLGTALKECRCTLCQPLHF